MEEEEDMLAVEVEPGLITCKMVKVDECCKMVKMDECCSRVATKVICRGDGIGWRWTYVKVGEGGVE